MTDDPKPDFKIKADLGVLSVEARVPALARLADDLIDVASEWLREKMNRKMVDLQRTTTRLMNERGREEVDPLNAPAEALRDILKSAAEKDDPALDEMFARLLLAATDPTTKPLMRQRFIETVRKFDPPDALLFKQLLQQTSITNATNAVEKLGLTKDDIAVSVRHLLDLGCLIETIETQDAARSGSWSSALSGRTRLSPYGQTLARALGL